MNIGSGKGYPNANLSNFSPHVFRIFIDLLPPEIRDNIKVDVLALLEKDENDRLFILCNSMEGFVQGGKRDKAHIQISICLDVGIKAKRRGSKGNKNWKSKQTLWFLGVPMKRGSDTYQKVLDVAFNALFENTKFKKALMATKGMVLKHSIGRNKKSETVLTTREFCSRLTKLRDNE